MMQQPPRQPGGRRVGVGLLAAGATGVLQGQRPAGVCSVVLGGAGGSV
jgi:hypothetical protein